MKTLESLMGTRDTVTVDRTMTVADAAELMTHHHIGAVPVTENGRLVGIFSERDVLTRVVAARKPADSTAVGDVMTTNLIVASIDETHETCLHRMQLAHVRHLPVIKDGRLAGIVSLRDLLTADIDEKSETLTLLSAYMYDVPISLTRES